MRNIYRYFILFILILLPANIQAGNVKNLDFVEYEIRAIYDDGKTVSMPLYEQAEKYGICDYGCTLELIDTGQTIKMKPKDEIVIENGVMKRKESP